jgi:hypothetical protein
MTSRFLTRLPSARARLTALCSVVGLAVLGCVSETVAPECDPPNDPPVLAGFSVVTDTVDLTASEGSLVVAASVNNWVVHPTFGSLLTLTATSPSGAQVARLDLRPGPEAGQYRHLVRRETERGTWRIEEATIPYLLTTCRDAAGQSILYANALTVTRATLAAFGDPLEFVVVGPAF